MSPFEFYWAGLRMQREMKGLTRAQMHERLGPPVDDPVSGRVWEKGLLQIVVDFKDNRVDGVDVRVLPTQ